MGFANTGREKAVPTAITIVNIVAQLVLLLRPRYQRYQGEVPGIFVAAGSRVQDIAVPAPGRDATSRYVLDQDVQVQIVVIYPIVVNKPLIALPQVIVIVMVVMHTVKVLFQIQLVPQQMVAVFV